MSRFRRVGLYRIKRVSSRLTAVASSNQVFQVVVVMSACIRAATFSHTSVAGFMGCPPLCLRNGQGTERAPEIDFQSASPGELRRRRQLVERSDNLPLLLYQIQGFPARSFLYFYL